LRIQEKGLRPGDAVGSCKATRVLETAYEENCFKGGIKRKELVKRRGGGGGSSLRAHVFVVMPRTCNRGYNIGSTAGGAEELTFG